jgi:ParB family chromosome partitioning protein
MTKRSGLGRGLDALIPAYDEAGKDAEDNAGVTQLPVNAITRNPHQPRTHFDAAELDELAASIREHGILQPLIVTQGHAPELYTLVAGERRLLAARQAGLSSVPVIVREASQQQLVEWALVENVQRADLSPLEAADAYRQLHEDFHLSQEEIALRVGKSRVAVTNTLRLLRLPDIVKQALASGQISEGHARALLGLPTPQAQMAALETVLQKDLTVRQTEELVRRLCGEKPPARPKTPRPPEILDLEERLRKRLGTKVNLNQYGRGGSLVIHYYSDEELDALVGKILGQD